MNWVQSTVRFTGVHWLVRADIRVISTAWGVLNFIVFIFCTATLLQTSSIFFFLDRLMDNIISVVITGDVRASTIMKLKLCSRIRKYINGDWLLGRRDDKITILCRGKITFWVPGKHAKRTDRQTDRDRKIDRHKQTNELIDRNPNVI